MNGNRICADTNIILYLLSGKSFVISEMLQGKEVYISFITELELLSYNNTTPEDLGKIKTFLNECIIIDVNSEIKLISIDIRMKYKLKIPDTIILATAKFLNLPLLTADKIFKKVSEYDIILFENS
ncbi:MAG: type II toxin-antitoxin system VapC family toxin [Ignavibacteria bacterium]|nr:type II toxin-antitoxin system VapC family toxin [Ignavibacteria bacterium]